MYVFEANKETGLVRMFGVIGRGFEEISSQAFLEMLDEMDGRDLTLQIQSEGGEVQDGLQIYNAIERYSGKITAVVDTMAYSVASVFPLAADKVVASANAMLMIHNAWTIAWGDNRDFRRVASALSVLDSIIADIYADKSGRPASFWQALMDAETWIPAQRSSEGETDGALELGLVDEIVPLRSEGDHKKRAQVERGTPVATASARAFPTIQAKRRRQQMELARLRRRIDNTSAAGE